MNHLYKLKLDDKLDSTFKELQKQFKKGERIVGTAIKGNEMIVTTEAPDNKRQLLQG